MGLVEKGGLLLTCTCSSAMATTPGAFLDMIKEAAQIAGRQVRSYLCLGEKGGKGLKFCQAVFLYSFCIVCNDFTKKFR